LIHATSLSAVLFGVWLLLSGHYTPLLLGLGGVSTLLVVAISLRMDVVDHEGHPLHLGLRILWYWPWLMVQVLRANVDVARRVLSPSLPISPRMFKVRATQRTDLGRVIYANSITLTPGTVSVELEGSVILVHALTAEAAEDLREGTMNRLVVGVEGHK
jgi:multicomponent Na+:H+ antiporter subunit E